MKKKNIFSDHFASKEIPPEMLQYLSDTKKTKHASENIGKLGMLRLKLEQDPATKRTIVKEQQSKVPLLAQRVLYMEESMPSMAYMYLMSQSGGILQGDRYEIDVSLAKGALVHLTTQGATRIYRMEKNYATQAVNLEVDDGCYLEYVPDQIIPYKDSRFYQRVNLKVHDSATAVYSEMVVPGRVASGESLNYDICYLRTVAGNQEGVPRFMDTCILEPKKRDLRRFGILGKFDVVGTMYILTKSSIISELNKQINSSLGNNPNISAGATILPHNSGILVRMLGNVANDLKGAVYETLNIVRRTVLNTQFSGMRKG